MKRVLCVWLPHWPLQRIRYAQPELERRTVVLFADLPRTGECVIARSRAAAKQGVAIGMPLAEAKGLLGASRGSRSNAVFLPHDPQADADGLRGLAVWCQRFSPVVGIAGADALLLDITGCAHLFGGERRLAARLRTSLERWKFLARTAIAETIGVAWAVAHYGGKPSAVVIPTREVEVLNSLPVEALRLSPGVVETLRELDVRRIEQLRALPRASLASRFGPEVALRLDQALGDVAELIEPVRPPQPVEAKRDFEHPTADKRALETVLRRLVEETTAELTRRQLGAQRLEVRLLTVERASEPVLLSVGRTSKSAASHVEGTGVPVLRKRANPSTTTFTIGLLQPVRSVSHLMELLRTRFERIAIPGEVAGVRLEAIPAALPPSRQHGLFKGTSREWDIDAFHQLIDRLSSRLGTDRVVRPRLCADPQPEFAVGWEPLVDVTTRLKQSCEAINRGEPITTHHSPLTTTTRPLFLRSEPATLEVLSVIPDGPPIRFFWNGKTHTVLRWWGPERIEAGWWRDRHARRDYYRVEIEDGRQFWLYRQLGTGKWSLHGAFD